MSKFSCAALVALGLALAAPGLAAADTYTLANFSAGIFGGNANAQAPFAGNGFFQGQTFTGSFVYDNDLLPGNTGLFTNVDFASFPDIAQIPPATAFQLNFGPLTFDLADASFAAIQYNPSGAFNGFAYFSDFSFLGGDYQLQIQGGSLQVVAVTNGVPGFHGLINGYVNIGDANVTGATPYTPPPVGPGPGVPEPATWGLMILGFGGIGAALRRRRTATAFA